MIELEGPHRRFNPLTQEWVLVSPHRARRPWLGQVEKSIQAVLPDYDPACYLCPGNSRAGGADNPVYKGTYVFDNDFAALLPKTERAAQKNEIEQEDSFFHFEPAAGICRVVCFSPRHDLTLPELSLSDVEAVIRTWADQMAELGSSTEIAYVQIFENKGEMMGCSNPHPHSQIWATSFVPNEPTKEIAALTAYQAEHMSCLLCDYLFAERTEKARLVVENDHFTALVPFWAVWPFELLVIAQRHSGSLTDLTAEEITGLADILRKVTIRYDNLFEISFPYSMGFHQAPSVGWNHEENHLHLHFYPPLLRSANVRKFMVGFEMLAMPQRDLTPETAAERLRSQSPIHYRSR
jgi:UDPglucose--hexose-1-phosphate uridylyltransferase